MRECFRPLGGVGFALLLVVAVVVTPVDAQGQVQPAVELVQGASIPLSDEAQVGAAASLGIGLALRAYDLMLFGPMELGIGQTYIDGEPIFRVDTGVGVQVMYRIGAMFLGGRLFLGLRIAHDERYDDVEPETGAPIESYLQLGASSGPVVWWPLTSWLVLSTRLEYVFSAPPDWPDPRGVPPHQLELKMGVVFVL